MVSLQLLCCRVLGQWFSVSQPLSGLALLTDSSAAPTEDGRGAPKKNWWDYFGPVPTALLATGSISASSSSASSAQKLFSRLDVVDRLTWEKLAGMRGLSEARQMKKVIDHDIKPPFEKCTNRLATYDATRMVGDAKGNQWSQVLTGS